MGSSMRRYKKLVLPLLLMALAPTSVPAQVPDLSPLNYRTRYDVKLAAVPIGHLFITTHETPLGYDLRIDTKTSGLVDLFSSIKSVATVRGTRLETQYQPVLYTSFADKDGDDHDRKVRLSYDEHGTLIERSRVPGDSARYRPVVPIEQASEAVDPITGFFVLRQKLHDAMARNEPEVSVQTYDGARLATMTLKVVSRARIEVDGKYVNAINTVVTRHPITGYTKKELKKFSDGDPVIHAYFSADDRFMPLMLTISLAYGDVKATLTKIAKPRS
jgi:hypothetical protein